MFDIDSYIHKTKNISSQLTALELFAGAGGMSLGIHKAGFKHVGLVEMNQFAVDTLRENSKRTLGLSPDFVLYNDARNLDYNALSGKLDLLAGGPPCQPFSTAGSNKGHEDPRNMFPIFFDVIRITRPKAILIENVKGLMRKNFREYVEYIVLRITYPFHMLRDNESWQSHLLRLRKVQETDFTDDEQYKVKYQQVNASDYGVPQQRERVLFVAFRKDLNILPFHLSPTHSKELLLANQWITGEYWEKYNINPDNYLGVQNSRLISLWKSNGISVDDLNLSGKKPWLTVRDALHSLPEPVERGSQEIVTNHVQHPGARVYAGHTGSHYDYPAKALKAGTHGTPGGENMVIIPGTKKVRYFTTREAARLQTFPDKYKFHGTWGACIKQLGNAVPVELINQFASKILANIEISSRRKK